jgi:hypothetical protein
LRYESSGAVEIQIASATASLWLHLHLKVSALNTPIVSFNLGGVRQCVVYLKSNGYVGAYRNDNASNKWTAQGLAAHTQLGSDGTILLSVDTWYSIDVEVTCDDSAGIVKTWVNGVADLNLTGQDTRFVASDTIDGVSIISNGVTARLDNLVIGNTTGTWTSHLGKTRVDCLLPTIGTPTDDTMTRSTGADNYALVDEVPANTTDYLYADAVGEKSTVKVEVLTDAGGTLYAVSTTVYARKTTSGPCGFKIYLLSGGTRYYSPEIFPQWNGWRYHTYVWDQHPDPSPEAWTVADLDACEFGTERTT